jgi:hypothetical protein
LPFESLTDRFLELRGIENSLGQTNKPDPARELARERWVSLEQTRKLKVLTST